MNRSGSLGSDLWGVPQLPEKSERPHPSTGRPSRISRSVPRFAELPQRVELALGRNCGAPRVVRPRLGAHSPQSPRFAARKSRRSLELQAAVSALGLVRLGAARLHARGCSRACAVGLRAGRCETESTPVPHRPHPLREERVLGRDRTADHQLPRMRIGVRTAIDRVDPALRANLGCPGGNQQAVSVKLVGQSAGRRREEESGVDWSYPPVPVGLLGRGHGGADQPER